jgi:hypothetical protein
MYFAIAFSSSGGVASRPSHPHVERATRGSTRPRRILPPGRAGRRDLAGAVGGESGASEDLHDGGGLAVDVARHRQRMLRGRAVLPGLVAVPVGGVVAQPVAEDEVAKVFGVPVVLAEKSTDMADQGKRGWNARGSPVAGGITLDGSCGSVGLLTCGYSNRGKTNGYD